MTPEAENILLRKITAIVEDLHSGATEEGEAMFLLGAGADRICHLAGVQTWRQLKITLKPADISSLLTAIDREGNAVLADEKTAQAYALQALGLSLTATASRNELIQTGADLLDVVIETTLKNYRQQTQTVPGTGQ